MRSRAAETVHISQLQFELQYMFTLVDSDPPTIGVPAAGTRLEEELVDAGDRDCEVQLLMNDFFIGRGAGSRAARSTLRASMNSCGSP